MSHNLISFQGQDLIQRLLKVLHAAVRRYSIEAGLKKSYFCQLKNGKEAVSYFSAGFKPE